MLSKHADRVCTFFAADFEPHFGVKLAEAAEKIYAEHKPQRVTASIPSHYGFRWPDDRVLMTLGFQRVAWQTLGFSVWRDRLDEHVALTKSVLRAIGVETCKRIGFKVQAYLPMEMSHAELSQLMFGSFLVPIEELQAACGEPNDPLVQIHGTKGDFEYVLLLSGMNKEQISTTFFKTNNLDQFRNDKFLDTTVKEFHEGLTRNDCFYFDVDLFQRDVGAETLDSFAKGSLAAAEQLASACVERLCSQPIKERR